MIYFLIGVIVFIEIIDDIKLDILSDEIKKLKK